MIFHMLNSISLLIFYLYFKNNFKVFILAHVMSVSAHSIFKYTFILQVEKQFTLHL